MKLLSFTKTNWKFLIFAVAYLVIIFIINFISLYLHNLSKNMENINKNIPLMLLINHFFLIFCVILKLIEKRKKAKADKKILKEEDQNENKNNLIYNVPEMEGKGMGKRTFLLMLVILLFDYLYNGLLMYYKKKFEKNSSFDFSQFYKFFDVLFLLVLFKFLAKSSVYNFQYLSLGIIIISGIGNSLINIIYGGKKNDEINLKFIIKSIGILAICSILDSIKIYYFKFLMEIKYVSQFIIGFLIGLFYLLISPILLPFFYYVDFGVSDIKEYFSIKGIEFLKGLEFLIILYSLLYSTVYLLDLFILKIFTPFHLILLAIFGELMTDCFNYYEKFPDSITLELIIKIVLYVIEIIGILVFNGTLILKCFRMNKNARNNIAIRGEDETKKIIATTERLESDQIGSELSSVEGKDENDNGNIH